jgi:hypothetical protein
VFYVVAKFRSNLEQRISESMLYKVSLDLSKLILIVASGDSGELDPELDLCLLLADGQNFS